MNVKNNDLKDYIHKELNNQKQEVLQKIKVSR